MNTDSPRPRCRWFARRLPLLAGGELTGSDRCNVERHLIACPACRRRYAALAGALDVLHAAAVETPEVTTASSSPSLWPALQRHIREERHAPRRLGVFDTWTGAAAEWFPFPFGFGFGPPARPRWRLLSLLAASVVLAALVAGGVESWAQWRVVTLLETARQPLTPPLETVLTPEPSALDPTLNSVLVSKVSPTSSSSESSRSTQVNYDLDTGTPMGHETHGRDPKASY
jgi:hypothetical protein